MLLHERNEPLLRPLLGDGACERLPHALNLLVGVGAKALEASIYAP